MKKSRRDFLKKVGLSLTAAATGITASKAANSNTNIELTEAQQQFLQKYKRWVEEFKKVVDIQKTDLKNAENNKRLAELADQSDEWKSELQNYLLDQNFAQEYLKISVDLTNKIKNEHPFG